MYFRHFLYYRGATRDGGNVSVKATATSKEELRRAHIELIKNELIKGGQTNISIEECKEIMQERLKEYCSWTKEYDFDDYWYEREYDIPEIGYDLY